MLSRVIRARGGVARLACSQRGASFSIWDRVHPSFWHPMATLEQSMMELDRVTSGMVSAPFHFAKTMVPRMHSDDDEFFKDLATPSSMKDTDHTKKKTKEKKTKDAPAVGADSHSYSSYSYSSSTILDEHGHRVASVRRRYEDSSGRLKAVHEREIDGKKLKTVWHRQQKDDEGDHKTLTDATSEEEFEKEWKQTPFGKADGSRTDVEKPQGVVQCEKEAEKITPGPDYDAAEKAPHKDEGPEAEGVTKEAHDRSREDAIAEGAKTQEEETTPPPKYTSGVPGYT